MNDLQNNITLLNKLIAEREEHFQHALSESAEQAIILHLKNDIDFLKEKRKNLFNEVNNREKNFFN